MHSQMKRKIAFALLMGVVTTGIISFTLLLINLGFAPRLRELDEIMGDCLCHRHPRDPGHRASPASPDRPRHYRRTVR